MYEIHADEVVLGRNVVIEDGVVIQGRATKNAKRVVLGDNVFIGRETRGYVDELSIGDYTQIHNHTLIAGVEPCTIGTCGWFGQNTVLNSEGGLTVGNGVGVGAYSQLWSHIRFGDMLQGCRFNSARPLIIEDDVWFVGHCIVSPILARRGSMAMVGSVVTRNMDANHVYGGVPAVDITEKVGPQYAEVSLDGRFARMQELYCEFARSRSAAPAVRVVRTSAEAADADPGVTTFDLESRTYNRLRTDDEFAFMKFLLGHLVRFYPR